MVGERLELPSQCRLFFVSDYFSKVCPEKRDVGCRPSHFVLSRKMIMKSEQLSHLSFILLWILFTQLNKIVT